MGAPSRDGLSSSTEPEVSALRASIPSAGSTLVPGTLGDLLYEIYRIADDYSLREAIERNDDTQFSMLDSFIWRDCMESMRVLLASAIEAEGQDTEEWPDAEHESATRKGNAQ